MVVLFGICVWCEWMLILKCCVRWCGWLVCWKRLRFGCRVGIVMLVLVVCCCLVVSGNVCVWFVGCFW